MLKTCIHCGVERPLSEFSRDSGTKDGHKPSCKACQKAYNAARYTPHPRQKADRTDQPTAVCAQCKVEKPRAEFNRNNKRPTGLQAYCKACTSERARAYRYDPEKREERLAAQRAEAKRYYANHPEKARKANRSARLKRQYGLTEDEFKALVYLQDNRCAGCGSPPPEGDHLHIDHCHETGRVRGLLCLRCNRALGLVTDSPSVLRALAAYLEAWPQERSA